MHSPIVESDLISAIRPRNGLAVLDAGAAQATSPSASWPAGDVTVCDINAEMLAVAGSGRGPGATQRAALDLWQRGTTARAG